MLKSAEAALIVIDVQEKLFRQIHEKEALLRALLQLIRGAKVLKLPILWAEQYPEGLGQTLAEITALLPGQQPIPKKTFNCLAHEPFRRALEATGRKQFLVAGIEGHVCVYQTSLDLLSRAFSVTAIADAVSSRTPENRQIGLELIRQAGGRISSVETALFEMLAVAEGPQFKEILQIVK